MSSIPEVHLSREQIDRLSKVRHRPRYKSLVRRLKFAIRCWQGRLLHPRFQRIKEQCLGMMYANVYHKLYNEVFNTPDGDIIEVGAAAGGCTVCAALARKESNKAGNVISIEKFEGGSRERYGRNFEENIWLYRRNLEHFNVQDRVKVFADYLTEEKADQVNALIETPKLAALIHDADGRIDRDFKMFYDRLVDGALIVIDDVVRVSPTEPIPNEDKANHVRKFMISCAMLDEMERLGLIEQISYTLSTVFCRKTAGATTAVIPPDTAERLLSGIDKEIAERMKKFQSA